MNSELEKIAEERQKIQQVLIDKGIWQCCLNCLNWNGATANANGPAGCGIYKQMPPPHIIVNGCKDYIENDDVPF